MDQFTYHLAPESEISHQSNNLPGLAKKRKFTDWFCLLLFLGCLGFSGFISYHSINAGRLHRLAIPRDSDGNLCGMDEFADLTEYKYLYFNTAVKIKKDLWKYAVCVNACPTSNMDSIRIYPTTEFPPDSHYWIVASKPIWNKFCLPSQDTALMENYISLLLPVKVETFFEALKAELFSIVMFSLIAIILAYLYGLLVDWWVRATLYISMIFALCGVITVSILFWNVYKKCQKYQNNAPEEAAMHATFISNMFFWAFIALWIAICLAVLFTIILFDKIRLSMRLIQAAGDFLYDVKTTVMAPTIIYILCVSFIYFWAYSFFNLYSTGTDDSKKGDIWNKFSHDTTTR